MNSKGHLYISLIKSFIRIVAAISAIRFNSLSLLALGFIVAECLGILEELFDKR